MFDTVPYTHDTPSADTDMAVHCVIGDDGLIWVYHDKPFTKTLSWIEYDTTESRIDFILEDGDIRNFGIPVDRALGRYLHNMQSIPVVLRRGDTMVDGEYYPLILHSA